MTPAIPARLPTRVTVSARPEPASISSCAVVRNLKLDDDKIRVIMETAERPALGLGQRSQTRFHWGLQFDSLHGSHFRYTRRPVPIEFEFAPLGCAAEQRWTPPASVR